MDNFSNSSQFESCERFDDSYKLISDVSISTQEDDLGDSLLMNRYTDLLQELDFLNKEKQLLQDSLSSGSAVSQLLGENERLRCELIQLEEAQGMHVRQIIEVLKILKSQVNQEASDAFESPEARPCRCILF